MVCKILVADDEPDVQDLIKQIFRSRIRKGEFTFEFAENGSVALDKLKSDPSIDVIFTDINMPVMDGLTLLSSIREAGLLQKAVVISAYGDLKNIRTAMNRGAFDFVTKPIDMADLETTLTKAISEMDELRKGLNARSGLEQALMEKAEAQQQALENLQEKERLILHQNELLEIQVEERTSEIIRQKEIIEFKNKEILDSIHYARRLQSAILPRKNIMKQLLPSHFALYLPKDIVAGDFYWVDSDDDYIYFAVADCTGHGVSGAFMSMLGVSLLNQVVKVEKDPGRMLDKLNSAVVAALNQQDNETNDGMDIILCRFDRMFTTVHFAGANRPLWLVRNAVLDEYKTDKVPVGGVQMAKDNFTSHQLALQSGDVIYLSTDGYADQFGGELGKKFMTRKMKELLTTLSSKLPEEQMAELLEVHHQWSGKEEQVDDILVAGLRF